MLMYSVWYMYVIFVIFVVFFFKQKTAYEMRISDWSSVVCSSDLPDPKSQANAGRDCPARAGQCRKAIGDGRTRRPLAPASWRDCCRSYRNRQSRLDRKSVV